MQQPSSICTAGTCVIQRSDEHLQAAAAHMPSLHRLRCLARFTGTRSSLTVLILRSKVRSQKAHARVTKASQRTVTRAGRWKASGRIKLTRVLDVVHVQASKTVQEQVIVLPISKAQRLWVYANAVKPPAVPEQASRRASYEASRTGMPQKHSKKLTYNARRKL
jgi:hypothetical protein